MSTLTLQRLPGALPTSGQARKVVGVPSLLKKLTLTCTRLTFFAVESDLEGASRYILFQSALRIEERTGDGTHVTPALLACSSPTPSRELQGDPRLTKEALVNPFLQTLAFQKLSASVRVTHRWLTSLRCCVACMPAQ